MTFDTLAAARDLEQAGLDSAQAEAITKTIRVGRGWSDEGGPGRARTAAPPGASWAAWARCARSLSPSPRLLFAS